MPYLRFVFKRLTLYAWIVLAAAFAAVFTFLYSIIDWEMFAK